MSQRDLPLWARGVAAALLLFASWWLLKTETLRGLIGDTIAPLSLGVVAAFILRGMHLPIGLWPNGPYRDRFSMGTVVAVAVAFGAAIAAAPLLGGGAPAAQLEVGTAALILVGILVWGFAFAFVQQQAFGPWYGIAAVAALAPWVVALLGASVRDGAAICLLAPGAAGESASCSASAAGTLLYVTATGAAATIVTVELAFRRLLIGHPDRAGLVMVAGAAVVATLWALLMSVGSEMFDLPWWLAALASVAAGSMYVLSGSLQVAALYSAFVYAGYEALRYATVVADVEAAWSPGWEYRVAHAVIAVLLAVAVARRKGVLRGII